MKPRRQQIRAQQEKWRRDVESRLPELLDELLASSNCASSPPRTHGVYLFSENGRLAYGGRTGWTERSKLAGKEGSSGFAARRRNHVRARHNQGTFAYRLAVAKVREEGELPGTTRDENCADDGFLREFERQCKRVGEMEFRVVEISDDKLAAVFEIYSATVLKTENSFATS